MQPTSRARRVHAVYLAILVSLTAGACTDPQARLDAFEAAFPDAAVEPEEIDAAVRPDGSADDPTEELPDITGAFFLTLVPAGLGVNVYYLAESELTAEESAGTLSLSMTALAVDGREPVGSPIEKNEIAVDSAGKFSADFGEIIIPGPANPVSDSDIVATITLAGTILDEDAMCGDATGMVTQPIALDLAGSTWGALRVEPGTTGADLPEPVIDCTTAGQLP